MEKIIDYLLQIDNLDFSIGDIVTVTEGEYKHKGLKLIEINESGICKLSVSPENNIIIEFHYDKVKSLGSYEEAFAKAENKTVIGILGGEVIPGTLGGETIH